MIGAGEALRLAGRDLYRNSWRLVPLNAAVGALLVLAVAAAATTRGAVVLVVLAGPLVAALAHCSVTLVQTGELAFADVRDGVRLHWQRGLALGAAGAATVLLGVFAVRVYSGSRLLWPLAFLTVYLVLLVSVVQLVLWTLAIAEPARPLRECTAAAARLIAGRPGPSLLLGLALLAVNVAGIAAAVMPFLTVTIAYSLVAAAHFALPPPEEAV
jgi:hypothetical protein